MIRKRKTTPAHSDGCLIRFRSAWKKTRVPTLPATANAIRNWALVAKPSAFQHAERLAGASAQRFTLAIPDWS